MGRLSCFIQVGPHYNHKCPYKGKVEGDLSTEKEDCGDRAEIRVMSFDDERRGHKPRKTGSQWELKRQGSAPPQSPLKEPALPCL